MITIQKKMKVVMFRERRWFGGTWTNLGIPMGWPSTLAAQFSLDQSGSSISSFEGQDGHGDDDDDGDGGDDGDGYGDTQTNSM